jgi:hypothetical protein
VGLVLGAVFSPLFGGALYGSGEGRCGIDPLIGFCIVFLLGSKYVGSLVVVGDLVEFRQAVKK